MNAQKQETNQNKGISNNTRILTLSAIVLGYALISDYSAYEQNSIGNWFMLVGQVLSTNSAFQQTAQEKKKGNTYNINSKQYKEGGSPYMNEKIYSEHLSADEEEIQKIKEVLENLIDKINNLK